MSEKQKSDPRVRFLSTALAIVLSLFWACVLIFMWWYFRNTTRELEGSLVHWISRHHILLVHLPIGMIFLVVILELMNKLPGFGNMSEATTITLWMTLLGAIGATLLGFSLMTVEEVAGRAMTFHLWTGLGVVVLCLIALITKMRGLTGVYSVFLTLTVLCTWATGHYGGAMVHEADYLSEYAPEKLRPALLLGLSASSDTTHSNTEVADSGGQEEPEIPIAEREVYSEFVVPILEKTCNECHNENKIKGKLRMDTHDLLLSGAEGSDFPTIIPGNAEDSELIVRVTLDKTDDDFMPPKGDGFTPEEIELLKWWIQAGASKETTVADLGDDPAILSVVAAVEALHAGFDVAGEIAEPEVEAEISIWETLSAEEQQERIDKARENADLMNISLMPVSAEDDRLRINVLNGAADFGDEQIRAFEPIAERVIWLNLAKSQITDEGMKTIGKMSNLEKLHLENTKVTDAGIASLVGLTKLEYLNLYATGVTNQIFETMKNLPSLRKVYVWQTGVDPAEAKRYEESVNLEINTGIDLEKAALEAQQKREEEERAKAEEDARKKAEEEKKKAAAEAKKKAEEAKQKAAAEARKKAEAEAAAKKKAEAAKAKAKPPAPQQPQATDSAPKAKTKSEGKAKSAQPKPAGDTQ